MLQPSTLFSKWDLGLCLLCVNLAAVVCGVSQPPGMNICVKQKKLDEKGGRVNWGEATGDRDLDVEGGVARTMVSDVCLARLIRQSAFFMYMCVFLYL